MESAGNIIKSEEVDKYTKEGKFKSIDDLEEMQSDGHNFLVHRCTDKCIKRLGYKGRISDYQCRKTNNLKSSPDNTRHCTFPLANKHDIEVIETLLEIGKADPVVVNGHG